MANNELKEVYIKSCTSHYLNELININILLGWKTNNSDDYDDKYLN